MQSRGGDGDILDNISEAAAHFRAELSGDGQQYLWAFY